MTVAAAPLYVVRWHIGPLPTTVLENLIGVTVVLYLVTLLRHRTPAPGRTPYEIPIALLLLAGVIGTFVAPDHRGALGILRAYWLEPVALFYVGIAVMTTAAAIEVMLAAWSAGAILFCIVDLYVFAHAVVAHTLEPGHAAAAFDINPNSVAMYLEPLIGLAAGFALFALGRLRWLAIAALIFLIPAEIATLSRGGLLALAAIVVVAIVSVKQVRLRIGLLAGAVAATALVFLLPLTGARLAHALDPVSGTVFGRERIWAATLRMLRDHPIFGAGLNAYQTVMAPYRLADSNLVPEPYPHNILLTSWTELGLLGAIMFIYLLANLLIRPWLVLSKASGIYQPLLWGTAAAFAMIAVHGLVDSPYWQNDLSVEFWILAALQVTAIRATTRPASA